MALGGPGNRYDPGLLRQHPGERDLRWRGVLLVGERLQPRDERQVGLAVLLRESWHDVAEVRWIERRLVVDRAGEKAFPEGAEGHEPDAEFLERWQGLAFRLAPPERVLALKRRDRLDSVRAADCLRAGFRE